MKSCGSNQDYEELRAKARLREAAFRLYSDFGAFTCSPFPWLLSMLYWLLFLLLPGFLWQHHLPGLHAP